MKSQNGLVITGVILLTLAGAIFIFPNIWNATLAKVGLPTLAETSFKLGLDLQGGTQLVYEAELGNTPEGERDAAMSGLRDVIERRVNIFGVAEPVVQINKIGEVRRLVVELAGVKDINEAIALIGETPFLEFREQGTGEATDSIEFVPTALNGGFLQKAQLEFDQYSSKPQVTLQFNDEGADLFSELTRRNIDKILAIYLDGAPISTPVVQEAITGGQAVITGTFTVEEAKQLVERLNAGALPVPIKLISQQSVGATLGEESLKTSLLAGLLAVALVGLFMIFWYRLPGLFSVLALAVYIILVLSLFKMVSVTLTLAGIAGIIMSLGMAVDANVLIFERMKEEARFGKPFRLVVEEGFSRAWTSIRDANTTTIITSAVLYYFGTGTIKGFALTLIIGTIVSMFSAIVVTRSFLRILGGTRAEKWRFLLKLPKIQT